MREGGLNAERRSEAGLVKGAELAAGHSTVSPEGIAIPGHSKVCPAQGAPTARELPSPVIQKCVPQEKRQRRGNSIARPNGPGHQRHLCSGLKGCDRMLRIPAIQAGCLHVLTTQPGGLGLRISPRWGFGISLTDDYESA